MMSPLPRRIPTSARPPDGDMNRSIAHAAPLAALVILLSQSGCIVVGGYSPGRGFFLWPMGLLFSLLFLVFIVFIARGRRRP